MLLEKLYPENYWYDRKIIFKSQEAETDNNPTMLDLLGLAEHKNFYVEQFCHFIYIKIVCLMTQQL